LKVAEFLESHPNVELVKYPFLKSHPNYEIAKKQMKLGGSIVAFEVKGGIEGGRNFLNKIKMCSLSANLGDTRTIVTHPASTTHSKLSNEERNESRNYSRFGALLAWFGKCRGYYCRLKTGFGLIESRWLRLIDLQYWNIQS
jgi:O-acetylhomoserine/O-acetylserine sulfhydrylase-like pyridoxal-dependent enzyme